MGAFKQGVDTERTASTVTAGGTTTLVFDSLPIQIFTGGSAQSCQLPDGTTLAVWQKFEINNRSSGAVTVKDGSGATLKVLGGNSTGRFRITSNGSVAGTWNSATAASSGGSGITMQDHFGIAVAKSGSYSELSRILKFNPEEIGGNYWLVKSTVPTSRYYAAGLNYNAYGYVWGGIGGSTTNERYDDDNNYWLGRTAVPYAQNFATSFSLGGSGVIAGSDSNVTTTYAYLDSSDAWTSKTGLPTGLGYQAGYALGGYGFSVGGYNAGTKTFNYSYDFTANAWYVRAPLTTPEYGSGNGVVLNGFGYVCGAQNDGGNSVVVQKYNISNNTWSTVGSFVSTSAGNKGSSASSAFILASGGLAGGSPQSASEQFNDITATWSSKTPLSNAVFAGVPFGINGTNYLVSGSTSSGGAASNYNQAYRDFSYISLRSLKRSNLTPSSILVAAQINGLTVTVPVQIRTDGDNWKTLTANTDSVLKTGEAFKAKFTEYANVQSITGYDGSSYNSVNQVYNDSSQIWTTKTAFPVTNTGFSGSGFTLQGQAFITFGNGAGAAVHAYNGITDAWASKAVTGLAHEAQCGGSQAAGYGWLYGGGPSTNNERYDATLNSWSTKGSLILARSGCSGGTLLGKLYVYGTITDSTTFEQYTVESDSWSNKTAMSVGRHYSAASVLGGYFYAVGGPPPVGSAGTMERYDQQANSWSTMAALSDPSYAHGANPTGGFIYKYSGYNGGYETGTYKYNPAANTWAAAGNTNTVATFNSGASGDAQSNAYRNYELRVALPSFVAGLGGGVWTTKAALNENREATEGFGLGGIGYTCGNHRSSVSLSATCEAYSELLNSWTYTVSLPASTGITGQGVLQGFGYITGGTDNNADTAWRNSNYQFDRDLLVWNTKATMTTARRTPATMMLSGAMYQATGFNGGNLAANEKYDPQANSWSTKTSASTARRNAIGGSVLGFGYVWAGGSPTGTTVEKYNDAADIWLTISAFPISTSNCSAIVIPGNTVLLPTATATDLYEYQPLLDAYALKSAPANGHGGSASFNGAGGAYFGGGAGLTTTDSYTPSQNKLVAAVSLKITEA